MDFQLTSQASGLGWLKHLRQSGWGRSVSVLENQHQLLSRRSVHLHQIANEARPVLFRAVLSSLEKPLACSRFIGDEEMTGALPLVFRSVTRRVSWLHRQRNARLANALVPPLIHTYLWIPRIVGAGGHVEHLFHLTDTLRMAFGRQTPLLFEPGLRSLLCRTCRTVSREMLSTRRRSTSMSASNGNVQRSRPSSG